MSMGSLLGFEKSLFHSDTRVCILELLSSGGGEKKSMCLLPNSPPTFFSKAIADYNEDGRIS